MWFSSVPNCYFCYNFRTFQNRNMGGNFEFIVHTHCNILQHTAIHWRSPPPQPYPWNVYRFSKKRSSQTTRPVLLLIWNNNYVDRRATFILKKDLIHLFRAKSLLVLPVCATERVSSRDLIFKDLSWLLQVLHFNIKHVFFRVLHYPRKIDFTPKSYSVCVSSTRTVCVSNQIAAARPGGSQIAWMFVVEGRGTRHFHTNTALFLWVYFPIANVVTGMCLAV